MNKLSLLFLTVCCFLAVGCTKNYKGLYLQDDAVQSSCSVGDNCNQTLGDFDIDYQVRILSDSQYAFDGTGQFTYAKTSSLFQVMRTMTLVFVGVSADGEIVCQFNVSTSGDMTREKTLREKFTCDQSIDKTLLLRYYGEITER